MDILFFSLLTNLLYYCCGKLFISEKNSNNGNQFYIYFLGFIVISFTALTLNFFIKLSPIVNTIVYTTILIFFIIKSKLKFNKDDFLFLCLSTFITFSLIIFSNVNRPDAGLYHLPFVSILNDSKIIFGINNIHFRFGHTSILQYSSAINNNFLFKENGVSIPLASIVSFFYIYFIQDIFKVIKKKETINVGNIFSLFIVIYTSYKINRYSGFGNDAVPHLAFFYLISYILKNSFKNIDFNKVFLISVFIFINKTTLGLVFIIPCIIFFIKKRLFSEDLLNLFISFPTFFLIFWLTKNLIISGCLIFPAKITCFENFSWTDSKQIFNAYEQSQAWSKGWPDRKNKNLNMSEFNKNFNWINAWSSKHLKYILKTIIPYILVLAILAFYIRKFLFVRHQKYKELNKRIYLSIMTSFMGVLSFFLIFPIYRYGYSFLISLIALIFILFLKNIVFSKKEFLFSFILFISILFFSLKQVQKVYNNYENDRWPNIYTLNEDGIVNEYKSLNISEKFRYFQPVSGDGLCMYSNAPCTNYALNKEIKFKNYYGYTLLKIK